jgi:hypothetical protein
MKYMALLIALGTILLSGCNKAKEDQPFAANYKGTFVRMGDSPAYSPIIADVTLNFTENTFSGTSNSKNYPAICSGSFDISQSKINVNNSCFFTADFDGTLIFQGAYNYEIKGDSLSIWRTYPNGGEDVYLLAKTH